MATTCSDSNRNKEYMVSGTGTGLFIVLRLPAGDAIMEYLPFEMGCEMVGRKWINSDPNSSMGIAR